eukprot:1149966-Pelagomonas_calceolata.AAC.2
MAPWCCLEPYFKIDVAMLCAVQMDAMQTLEAIAGHQLCVRLRKCSDGTVIGLVIPDPFPGKGKGTTTTVTCSQGFTDYWVRTCSVWNALLVCCLEHRRAGKNESLCGRQHVVLNAVKRCFMEYACHMSLRPMTLMLTRAPTDHQLYMLEASPCQPSLQL